MQDVVESLTEALTEVRTREEVVRTERKGIEQALKALNPSAVIENGSKPKNYDPAKIAGEKNIATVAEYLKFKGTSRQADVVKDTGLNAGTVSCALQALKTREQAKPTGLTDNRSKVWDWTGEPVRKTRARRSRSDQPVAA
jgi:hypothetical protein